MATFRNKPTSTENYRNPDHQKYVTGDGWKSGESKTGAPGEGPSMSKAPEPKAGLKAETARPQASSGMTGNQSMPEMKTKLGISVVCIKPNGGQMGQIKGGDPHNYLGHFRSPKVLKDGHNQGAPGALPLGQNAPMLRSGQSAPSIPSGQGVRPSTSTGASGTVGAAPVTSGAGDMPPLPVSVPRSAPTAPSNAGVASAPALSGGAMRAGMRAGRQAARMEKKVNVGEAKTGLKTAIGNVRSARQGLRSAVKGGDVSGAESAFGKLKEARGERRIARQGVRKARRG